MPATWCSTFEAAIDRFIYPDLVIQTLGHRRAAHRREVLPHVGKRPSDGVGQDFFGVAVACHEVGVGAALSTNGTPRGTGRGPSGMTFRTREVGALGQGHRQGSGEGVAGADGADPGDREGRAAAGDLAVAPAGPAGAEGDHEPVGRRCRDGRRLLFVDDDNGALAGEPHPRR
jgi:hypothetical protein